MLARLGPGPVLGAGPSVTVSALFKSETAIEILVKLLCDFMVASGQTI